MDLRLYSPDPSIQLEAMLEHAHHILDKRGVPKALREEDSNDSHDR